MNKVLLIGVAVIVMLGLGYFMFFQNSTTTEAPMVSVDAPFVVALNEQNASGETGTVSFIERDGKLVVSLEMAGAPQGVSQPAHIHSGTCADIGGVVHPLEFPLDGVSETVLDTSLDELATQMPLAVNVHKSPQEASVYVSCGDLPL